MHYRAAEHGCDANSLPKVFGVDDLVSLLRRSGSSLKLFKQGDPYEEDDFTVAYLDGASLIVNQADRYHPMLFALCRVLAQRHFYHVFSVVYLTPPNSQAVRLHNDDQDVFLLQVWGTKKWTIRNAPTLLPYTEEMLGKGSPVPQELVGEPTMQFTMQPHDVLYIPRGFLHEAETSEFPSLHVTVTMPTSDYCWGVQLVKQFGLTLYPPELPTPLRNCCDASLASFRRPGGPVKREEDETMETHLKELTKMWLASLSVESVVNAFESRMSRTNDGQEKGFHNNMELQMGPFVTESSRVRLMHGISSFCELDSKVAIFQRAPNGEKLEMPITPSAAALICSLTSRPQKVTDLPCIDAFERVCALQVLHNFGVVQLFTSS